MGLPLDFFTVFPYISVMTEITVNTNADRVELSPAIQRFILHWGDLGTQWGVNRSVAQIQALLLLSERPMHAEEISETLTLARSNVSNSVKELLSWNLIRRVPILGDRRDHYEAEKDMWEMITHIAEMRKAREIDPAAQVLQQCLDEARNDPSVSKHAIGQLEEMQGFVVTVTGWFDQMIALPKDKLMPLVKLGTKAVDMLVPFLKKK